MSERSRRPLAFISILIVAIAAYVSFRPDSTENKSAASSAPSKASRPQSTAASTLRSETVAAPAIASSNQPAAQRELPQFAPLRLEIRAPATVRAGDTFQLTVDVGADRGIRKLGFTVNFNKRVLQLVGSSQGAFVQQGLPVQFEAQEPSYGVVLVNLDLDNGQAIAGVGSVVIMDFQAVKPGTSSVKVDSIELVESGRTAPSPAPVVNEILITVE